MGYSVKFEHPDFPEDTEFEISGVGLVKNGGSVEMDAAQEQRFLAVNRKTPEDYFEGNESITLSGTSELGDDVRKSMLEAEVSDVFRPTEEEKAAMFANPGLEAEQASKEAKPLAPETRTTVMGPRNEVEPPKVGEE